MVKKFSQYIESILIWQVKRLIRAHKPKIVAVTGSVGKTSTKYAVAHVLSGKYRVQADTASYNTAIGLPLAIFGHKTPRVLVNPLAWLAILINNEKQIHTPANHDIWVLEMGAERKGEISRLVEFIKPDIGIVTAVKNVHVAEGQFTGIEEILEEKWHLAKASKLTIANCEDPLLAKKTGATTYGLERGDYHFEQLKFSGQGFSGGLKLKEKKLPVEGGLIARHSLYAIAAAAGVANELGLDAAEIAARIKTFAPAPGRMNPLPGRHGTLIIDDSYNASPDTVTAALETLYSLPGRQIAILGSMNELGSHAETAHKQVGEFAAKVDLLVTVGDLARSVLAKSAKDAGLSEAKIRSFDDPYRAGEFVAANLKKGDVVLVKGSQNKVYTEEATKQLLANREDREKLVRQSPDWLERKKRSFQLK